MVVLSIFLAFMGQLVSADQQQQLALSSASSDFSQRLYQKVALNKSNVVYSPYSIHSLLTMTSLGARGDTAAEMKNVLGITSLGESVHSLYRETIQQLNSQSNVQLLTGNAIFINPSYPIVPEFIQETANEYFALTDHIDFSANGGPEKPINDYVEAKTEHVIKDLLEPELNSFQQAEINGFIVISKPGAIDNYTVMLLVNTIFFNGTWNYPFDVTKTGMQDFQLLGGAVKQVDMMSGYQIETNIKTDDVNKVDVAEIAFKGKRFALYIALPQEVDGITDLEILLQKPGKVDELLTGFDSKNIKITMPKFRIETKIELKDVLIDMGMVQAFSDKSADFSGLSQAQVYISKVIHKAVIEVQESGTVAAAVTAAKITGKVKPVPFIADHPFLYFLRDKETGQVIFQGKFSG
ncbi:serpin B6-like [Biomphalaria glabrata]|uniref:Serpin B6-like n=1 Tax=Biomphalaria glabrata TaxID=6526 RepID=A0A9W2YEY5_BIOGL|nr:serpin B6-like [Biomphalaria glabrata]